VRIECSPYGEYFFQQISDERLLFFHGGFGKVAAAASTQYVIDHFQPIHLINIGTCGGVEGRIQRFDVVVPDKLVIYDIYEGIISRKYRPDYAAACCQFAQMDGGDDIIRVSR
jgi:adenosylhomocysteine nucleosidase